MDLSDSTKKLISKYNQAHKQGLPKEGVATIHVDEVAKKVAAFYERVRSVVDWKEEHLMRRAAINRKLKRKFFDLEMNKSMDTMSASESLVLELIRSGLFPNDKIEESKIGDIKNIIDKYAFILKNNPENQTGKAGVDFYNWIMDVASCELEETLSPAIREMALIDYMFSSMKEKIKVSDKFFESGLLKKENVNTQIYIGVCQALFKLDKPMIGYNLLRYKFPEWKNASQQAIEKISQDIFKAWQQIEKDLKSPLANRFYNICEKYDTPYLLIGDILLNKNSEIEAEISEPTVLEGLVKETYSKRLTTLRSRISRAAIYSTISIFVTKVLSLVVLEVLIEKYLLGGEINRAVLIADVLIPTVLMFLILSTVKRPSKKNLNLVTMETVKIVYKKDVSDIYEIKTGRKKSTGVKVILSLMYTISAFITFGLIYYILNRFGFPISSIIIDIIFIALILFAGTAIAKRSQELTMEDEKEGFLSFIVDIFFIPVQSFGRWLSNKWKRYNFFTAILNALIDMPFSVFVEFLENWRYFIRERKEEIR